MDSPRLSSAHLEQIRTVLPAQEPCKPVPSRWQVVLSNILWLVQDLFKILFCYGKDQVFRNACEEGHTYTAIVLANRENVNDLNEGVSNLYVAAINNHKAIVKHFAPKADEENLALAFSDCMRHPHLFPIAATLVPHLSREQLVAIDNAMRPNTSLMRECLLHSPFCPELVEGLAKKEFDLEMAFRTLIYESDKSDRDAFLEEISPVEILTILIEIYERTSGFKIEDFRFTSMDPSVPGRSLAEAAISSIAPNPEIAEYLCTEPVVHQVIQSSASLRRFLPYLSKFDATQREQFVLAAIEAGKSVIVGELIEAGCGVANSELSPLVQTALEKAENAGNGTLQAAAFLALDTVNENQLP